jgi:hypothetical protein
MTMRITKAQLKKFINENKDNLYILESSFFCGMEDMVTECKSAQYQKIDPSKIDFSNRNTYGIDGLWLVRMNNWIEKHDSVISVSNCCGSSEFKVIQD